MWKFFTLKFDIREAIMESMDLYFKFLPDKEKNTNGYMIMNNITN